jgi:hypothetical protein
MRKGMNFMAINSQRADGASAVQTGGNVLRTSKIF